MSNKVIIDGEAFYRRIKRIYKVWKSEVKAFIFLLLKLKFQGKLPFRF